MGGVQGKQLETLDDLVDEMDQGRMDPRSPTPNVDRTPILKSDDAKLQKITKNVDLTKECFEKYSNNVPLNPAIRAIMNEVDPRSPTLDFQRTPLSVLIKNPELMAVYNRVNAAESLNPEDMSFNEVDNTNSKIEIEACIKNLENDLANLSTTQNEIEETDSHAKVLTVHTDSVPIFKSEATPVLGLLETNLDYVETDLDTVRRRYKKRPKAEEVIEIPPDEPEQESVSVKDPRSPSEDFERTPIVVGKEEDRNDFNLQMKEIFNHNMVLQQKRCERIIKNYNSDPMLIYEDNLNDIKVSAIKKVEGSRTPLASMINIDQTNSSKSKSREKSIKKCQSKIPVKVKPMNMCHMAALQNINTPRKGTPKKNRMIDMSENTPPNPRKARWDQDNSVIL